MKGFFPPFRYKSKCFFIGRKFCQSLFCAFLKVCAAEFISFIFKFYCPFKSRSQFLRSGNGRQMNHIAKNCSVSFLQQGKQCPFSYVLALDCYSDTVHIIIL